MPRRCILLAPLRLRRIQPKDSLGLGESAAGPVPMPCGRQKSGNSLTREGKLFPSQGQRKEKDFHYVVIRLNLRPTSVTMAGFGPVLTL